MFSFAALPLLAAAIAVSPSPSPTPLTQITHVVTSDRSDETLRNTVRTTYVVTAADIARNGYRTVSEAIANVPGVEIESYGPIGASADYGIRGSSSTQTLVLIDGVPAPGGLANSVQLGAMPTTGIERIEIVEGGGSTLYGQGAIGGIINVITDASKASPSATLSYGTFDDREFQVQDAGFSFDHIVANNAFGLPPSAGNPDLRSNDDFEETTARYGLDRTIGALALSFRTSLGSDDIGADGFFPDVSPTSREHDVNEDAALTLSMRRAQSDPSATLFGSRQLITFDCIDNPAVDPNCFQTAQSLSQEGRTGVDLRNVVTGSAERLVYGADLSRGVVTVNDGEGDPVASNGLAQSAAYAQETWTGARAEYYAGARAERDGSLGGEVSPSLGARFTMGDGVELKLNAATAFRAPNASELYFPNYGNPNLQPERADVGDATLTDNRILGGTSLGWFDNYTRELIVLKPPTYLPENVDHARLQGFTFSTQTRPLNGIRATLNATDLYAAEDLDQQTRLPDDAVFTVNLGLAYTGAARSFLSEAGVSERAVGQRGVDTSEPLFAQPIAYSNLSAYVRFRIAPNALLSVRGDNLGNERYAQIDGYPMPGRTFAVELRAH